MRGAPQSQESKCYVMCNLFNTSYVEAQLNMKGFKFSKHSLGGSQTLFFYELYVNDADLWNLVNDLKDYGFVSRQILPVLNPALSQEVVTIVRYNSLSGDIASVFNLLPVGQNSSACTLLQYKATATGSAGTVALSFGGGTFSDSIPASSTSTLMQPLSYYCNKQPKATLTNIASSSCAVITELINRAGGITPTWAYSSSGTGTLTAGSMNDVTDSNTVTYARINVTLTGSGIQAASASVTLDMGGTYKGYVNQTMTSPAGFSQTLQTSIDGITWTTRTAGTFVASARYVRVVSSGNAGTPTSINFDFKEIVFWAV